MLQKLFIQNIALISQLTVDFSSGLCIITGETGAGKSIIIDSIGLVLGERAGRELIKTGETKAKVEAHFTVDASIAEALEEQGIECDDDTIIIARELSASKNDAQTVKSVCRINGAMVSASVLKEITSNMVDVHGQHEHQALLAQHRHMGFLDSFAADNISPLLARVKGLYKNYKDIEKKMYTGFVSEQERAQRIDILTYQINEIESLALVEGEEEQLEEERKILSNGEMIMRALYTADQMLNSSEGGALTTVKSACNELYPIADVSEEYSSLADTVSEAYYALEAAAYTLSDTASSFSFDAQRQDAVEARLGAIAGLKRKYGSSVASIIEFADNARQELETLEQGQQLREQQQAELEKLRAEYQKVALELSQARKAAAIGFSNQVMSELTDLGLGKSRFSVSFAPLEGDMPSQEGIDYVEFMFTANPGEPEKPLRKVASGGEISRIMLALKSVLSDTENTDTMIFDEIDTGISGTTATTVGLKMQMIARKKQVLAITHLPQIAAFADVHFLVEKIQTDDATNSMMVQLDGAQRAREVARIMGDKNSDAAINHANELIAHANMLKSGK